MILVHENENYIVTADKENNIYKIINKKYSITEEETSLIVVALFKAEESNNILKNKLYEKNPFDIFSSSEEEEDTLPMPRFVSKKDESIN